MYLSLFFVKPKEMKKNVEIVKENCGDAVWAECIFNRDSDNNRAL